MNNRWPGRKVRPKKARAKAEQPPQAGPDEDGFDRPGEPPPDDDDECEPVLVNKPRPRWKSNGKGKGRRGPQTKPA